MKEWRIIGVQSGSFRREPAVLALILLGEEARASLKNGGSRDELEHELIELRNAVNAGLNPHERLMFLGVARDPWTIENGMLTPTMKIQRHVIEEHYGAKIDGWYNFQRNQVIW